jgi:hypothetical protein
VASVVWLGEGSGNVLATRIQKRCCGDNSYRLVRNRQNTTHDYFIFCSVVLVAVSWPDIDLVATAMHYYLCGVHLVELMRLCARWHPSTFSANDIGQTVLSTHTRNDQIMKGHTTFFAAQGGIFTRLLLEINICMRV